MHSLQKLKKKKRKKSALCIYDHIMTHVGLSSLNSLTCCNGTSPVVLYMCQRFRSLYYVLIADIIIFPCIFSVYITERDFPNWCTITGHDITTEGHNNPLSVTTYYLLESSQDWDTSFAFYLDWDRLYQKCWVCFASSAACVIGQPNETKLSFDSGRALHCSVVFRSLQSVSWFWAQSFKSACRKYSSQAQLYHDLLNRTSHVTQKKNTQSGGLRVTEEEINDAI